MPIAGSQEVAALIESKRRRRGISVTELTRRIGVDGKRLWYVPNGQREMQGCRIGIRWLILKLGLLNYLFKDRREKKGDAYTDTHMRQTVQPCSWRKH